MENIKVTFDLSKEYIKSVMMVMGVENCISELIQELGDECTIDIDRISKMSSDMSQIKLAMVALLVCHAKLKMEDKQDSNL